MPVIHCPTVTRTYLERARSTPDLAGFRYRPRPEGPWQEATYRDHEELCRLTSLGLMGLGIKPRDRVAILSGTRFDWAVCDMAVLGAAEEVGELAHAFLKMEQGIRGKREEHEANMKDAVGDCVIFLMDLCNQMGWDFENIVDTTWSQVKQRDWKKNSHEGVVSTS